MSQDEADCPCLFDVVSWQRLFTQKEAGASMTPAAYLAKTSCRIILFEPSRANSNSSDTSHVAVLVVTRRHGKNQMKNLLTVGCIDSRRRSVQANVARLGDCPRCLVQDCRSCGPLLPTSNIWAGGREGRRSHVATCYSTCQAIGPASSLMSSGAWSSNAKRRTRATNLGWLPGAPRSPCEPGTTCTAIDRRLIY
jgi:hypothetical protein